MTQDFKEIKFIPTTIEQLQLLESKFNVTPEVAELTNSKDARIKKLTEREAKLVDALKNLLIQNRIEANRCEGRDLALKAGRSEATCTQYGVVFALEHVIDVMKELGIEV